MYTTNMALCTKSRKAKGKPQTAATARNTQQTTRKPQMQLFMQNINHQVKTEQGRCRPSVFANNGMCTAEASARSTVQTSGQWMKGQTQTAPPVGGRERLRKTSTLKTSKYCHTCFSWTQRRRLTRNDRLKSLQPGTHRTLVCNRHVQANKESNVLR